MDKERIKKDRMEIVNCCNNLMYNRVSCIIFSFNDQQIMMNLINNVYGLYKLLLWEQ